MKEGLDKQKYVPANQGKLCFLLDLHKFLYNTYQPRISFKKML